MRSAAFLDRDGVLNVDVEYLSSPERLIWISGAARAVNILNRAGFLVFVVTNQSGVARGYYDEEAVVALHEIMRSHLHKQGAEIDEIVYCPHHPDSSDPRYGIACGCRKPEPGMLLKLIEKHNVDPGSSLMIGDKLSDMEAARAAGVAGFLFEGGALDLFVDRLLSTRQRS